MDEDKENSPLNLPMRCLARFSVSGGFVAGMMLPLSLIGLLQTALDREAMAMATYESLLLPTFGWALKPGTALLGLLGLDPAVTAAHAKGWLFWQEFVVQFGANWIGWTLLLAVVGVPLCWLGQTNSGRLETPLDVEPTRRRGLRSRLRLLMLGGLVGVALPPFLLGLLLLSHKDALSILVKEGSALAYLLTAILLPGEGLLFPADGSLAPFSGLSSPWNFWVSSVVLLLANWGGWTAILVLVSKIVLPRVRSAAGVDANGER